jgi:predicted metal-dependent HD superfamily phosphohydrolase
VPDLQFQWGRAAYVQNWLKLPYLFFTDSFRTKEEQARENLKWELEEGLRHI